MIACFKIATSGRELSIGRAHCVIFQSIGGGIIISRRSSERSERSTRQCIQVDSSIQPNVKETQHLVTCDSKSYIHDSKHRKRGRGPAQQTLPGTACSPEIPSFTTQSPGSLLVPDHADQSSSRHIPSKTTECFSIPLYHSYGYKINQNRKYGLK